MRRPVSTWCARLAQSVEQGIENPRVRGSIPRPGTIILLSNQQAVLKIVVSPIQSKSFEHYITLVLTPPNEQGSMVIHHKGRHDHEVFNPDIDFVLA